MMGSRKCCLALVVACVAGAAMAGPAAADEIVLSGLGGGQLAEGDLARGSAILVVWASKSPACADIVPRLNRLAGEWSSQATVASMVMKEDSETVTAFLAGKGLKPPVYLDAGGALSKKHGVNELPSLLIFKEGRLAFSGKLPPNPDPVIRQSLG